MSSGQIRLAVGAITAAIGGTCGAIVGYFIERDGTSWGFWIAHPLSMNGAWWIGAGAIMGLAVDFIRRH